MENTWEGNPSFLPDSGFYAMGDIAATTGREDVHADVSVAFAATVRYYASLLG